MSLISLKIIFQCVSWRDKLASSAKNRLNAETNGAALGAARRFSASAPGVNPALQMRSLALSTVGEFEKERTRLGPKSDFFFGVRNWMCGVRACENMQKRVSHGETVRVGSSGVVRFAKQFPARTLGGVTLFVEDDLRDAFFVGVSVVVDCLFTFSQ